MSDSLVVVNDSPICHDPNMLHAEKELAYLMLAGYHYDNENVCIYSPGWDSVFFEINEAKAHHLLSCAKLWREVSELYGLD